MTNAQRQQVWERVAASLQAERISDLLYAVGMESPTGWQHMKELCDACGVPYPPQQIQKGEPAPVTLAFP